MSENTTVVPREAPTPTESRHALVTQWNARVSHAKNVYQKRFDRIRELQRFTRGRQWPKDQSDNYVVNITLRHINQRTAALYAKNPKAVAKTRPKLISTVWDGTVQALEQAHETMALARQAASSPEVAMNPAAQEAIRAQVSQAQAVLADFERTKTTKQMQRRMGETLGLLYDYNIDEQALNFKALMKLTVRRALTTGIGWVKLGFQRATQMKPEVRARIADMSQRLRRIEQGSADLADGEIMQDSAEAEQLRLEIQDLTQQAEILVREGLTFDYPGSTDIIPDPNCKNIKTFLGCSWVAQEYLLSTQEIQQIYGIDVGQQYAAYRTRFDSSSSGEGTALKGAPSMSGAGEDSDTSQKALALVREIYCKDSGLVYVVCDGFPEFLQEPSEPEVWTERFYPWYALVFNEVDDDEESDEVFPPSDVELIQDAQLEINRSREALREHRIANRPAYASAGGMLSEQDKQRLADRPPNALVELQGLQPGQSVDQLLQRIAAAPLDPALYNIDPQFQDILRAGGLQEANLGGTAGNTATESSIAASSLSVNNNSSVDDLDDLLTAMARSGGQILLAEVSEATVQRIVGPGAVWPQLSRNEIARDLWLEVEAGSTGRPNQAQEIMNAERVYPLLLQIPGVSPTFLAEELIRRLDDRLDLNEVLAAGIPSVVAQNAQQRPGTGNPRTDPAQQGSQGGAPPAPAPPAPGAPGGADTTSVRPTG